MKKSLLKIMAVCMAVLFLQLQVFAGSSFSMSAEDDAIVNFDETEIYASFDQMNDLASYLSENDATYSEVENFNSSLVTNVSSSAALALNSSSAGEPPFISAFLWGCVFNWVGIVVVALTTDMDMDYIMKSVWGCALNSVVVAAFYVIYYVLILGSWGGYYY
jgi:hypothetical protein